MSALLSIPIASYCSIKRLALNYFSYAQQDHKLNGIGIIFIALLEKSVKTPITLPSKNSVKMRLM